MATYQIEISETDPEGDTVDYHTTTRTIELAETGRADRIARIVGAGLGSGAGWHISPTDPPLWRVQVREDGGEQVEYTQHDEAARCAARDRIVNWWNSTAAPLHQAVDMSEPLDDTASPELLDAAVQLYGLRDVAIMRLEPLGFRVDIEWPESTAGPVYDALKGAGVLRALSRMRDGEDDRDELIRAAFVLQTASAEQLAAAAGLSASRIYQIRDGRR